MPWLTTEEAAEILGYHDESIRRLLRSKKLQGRKFGHIWLIEPQSVTDFHARVRNQGLSKNDPRRGK